MFYAIIFAIIAFVGYIETQPNHIKLKHQLAFCLLVVLGGVAGLRYETGIDWITYSKDFDQLYTFPYVRLANIFGGFNPVFKLLEVSIKSLGGNIQVVFIVVQIVVSLFLWKALNFLTDYKITALLLYFALLFFHLDMNLMKQAVAVAIFYYSIQFIGEKSLVKYTLFIILATLFHWSAFVWLPLYFILNRRFPTPLLLGLIGGFLVFYILQVKTAGFFYDTAISIFGETSKISGKMDYYVSSKIYGTQRTFTLGFIPNVMIVLATLFFRKRLSEEVKYFDIFLNLMIVQLFLYMVMYEYIEISGRFRYYPLISYLIILPYFIQIFRIPANKSLIYLLIVVYSFAYASIYLGNSISTIAYRPYQNYIIHQVFKATSNGRERVKKYFDHFNKERKKKH